MSKPRFATQQDLAEDAARQLIYSWAEDGRAATSDLPPDQFPNKILATIAEAAAWASEQGIRGMADILTEAFTDAPAGIREEFIQCCDGMRPPSPEHCGPLVEKLRAFHIEKTRRELGDKMRQAIERGESINGFITRIGELENGAHDPATRFCYDGTRYYLDTAREFVPMDQRSAARHMRGWGHDHATIESALCRIQTDGHIHFAGPLAGHPRGLHAVGGAKLLATVSPEIIESAAGPWPTLRAVLDGLLADPDAGQTQVETFLAWLKIARESLVTNRRRPGQALALAGPRGSGKSLLIDVTEMALGGRRANPYAYFTGRTNFNADLAGAELLAVDDEAGSTDIRSRRTLASNIKSCLFSGAVRIEGKNKTAFTFRPCWRMLVALNDEPEALLVLPPITEDIGDKITLFKCHKRPLPMSAHTLDEREAFFAKLREELPGMLAWLENWNIPEDLREERCGVRAFHHSAILAALHELSPEGQLVALIDTASAAGVLPLPWTGTAAELKSVLCGSSPTARDSEKLLGSWHAAAGSYLARLEGDRVERLPMLNGVLRWRVLPSGLVG